MLSRHMVRDALKKVLSHINIPLRPLGFHTFRKSRVTLAFDNNIALQNSWLFYGLWRSSAIWTYVEMLCSPYPSSPLHLNVSSLLTSSWAWGFLNFPNVIFKGSLPCYVLICIIKSPNVSISVFRHSQPHV